jgi:hypothetical protein
LKSSAGKTLTKLFYLSCFKTLFMRSATFILLISVFLFSCGENKEPSNKDPQASAKAPGDTVQQHQDTTVATPAATATALTISTQNVEGNLGQVTFSQNEKTVFYYDQKTKKGKVVLNNTDYVLNKYTFDGKSGSYQFSGDNVSISAPNCKYKKQNGEDCSYGTFADVTITQGTSILVLHNVAVQDCPNY